MSQEPQIIQWIARLLMLLSLCVSLWCIKTVYLISNSVIAIYRAQTVIAFYNTWRIVVTGFGSWVRVFTISIHLYPC